MKNKSLAPVQITLPPVGNSAVESVALSDFRMNEKLAAVEQRIRELESLLSAASNERVRLMKQISEVRGRLLEMESSKAAVHHSGLHRRVPQQLLWNIQKIKGFQNPVPQRLPGLDQS